MQGDFSTFHFDPHENERGVVAPSHGVLRNVNGVLLQQGRVITDADINESELLELEWKDQAGRDIIGADVCAVPATEPEGFRVETAAVVGGQVHLSVRPGRAWADGILTRLAGAAAAPQAPVDRLATYFGPPIAIPQPTPASLGDGIRDAVVLEVSEEAIHGFQYPDALIEPALGGPDTSERVFVNFRFKLLRLGTDEVCTTIVDKLRDDPDAKGHLTATLAPVIAIGGDCPVVGGGGYTGFEHNLVRIEIADTPSGAPARFKWSQWNGGLAGRGRFDATVNPARVYLDAGRAAIVNSGLFEFYLEALQYDELIGAWQVVYASTATLNTDHDLELAAPPAFGTLPSTTASVFIRLWNGVRDIADFTNVANPVELRDGIRLAFDAPAAGNYRPGDYWTFKVRAGEIGNPATLIDDAPPVGIVYHRVALAEIQWTGRLDTSISGHIEDCRRRFRPLVNQKICCTYLIGDGITSFGDFNSLEEAAEHLPVAGGELCLLPGLHRANLRLVGARNVKIHGCARRSLVLPHTETRVRPILRFIDCVGIEVLDLDLVTYDGIAVAIEGTSEGSCRDVNIHHNRMIARSNAIRATNAAELVIADNRLHLLDTVVGRATISVNADDTLIERNTLALLPFIDRTPNDPEVPSDDPGTDPADPCARPEILYQFPKLVLLYAVRVWTFAIALLVPKQPYRAIGGIHVRAGSERVRILENHIAGGAGNGITLGGDLDPATSTTPPTDTPTPTPTPSPGPAFGAGAFDGETPVAVSVNASGQFLARVQDEQSKALSDVDVYLEADAAASDRSDAQGLVSVKTAPGNYTLSVSPAYRVVGLSQTTTGGVALAAVSVAVRDPATLAKGVRGFLHEITIEANDVSMMGLSGIGFALRSGARLAGSATTISGTDPKANLLAFIDAAILNLALTPLLRATDPVRDLVILNNRLHHNLKNPFTQALLADAQVFGRGGVSLGVVESVVVSGNHVYDNGGLATDPICGVFIGYGNDLEITDNVLSSNGRVTSDYEESRRAGLRGGVFIRFAGALTTQFSTSSGRKPALRVHDNRVDQPAGRALTAYAFGPVSVANNHLNSEFTGRFGFIDTAVGGVLIANLGGIHRLLARTVGKAIDNSGQFAALAEAALPGGETMFDDNYVRLGSVNRSLMSQVLLCLDDLGYAANTASVFRREPFFANALLLADTVRATASRFREDADPCISLYSHGLRINTTALNQADHCIVTRKVRVGTNPLPTVDQPNQVLDAVFCARQFSEASGLGQFLVQVLAAYANELGGTLPQNSFSTAEVATLGQQSTANSLAQVNTTQVTTTKAYSYEAARLSVKLGADHPTTVAMRSQAEAGITTSRLLSSSAEAATVQTPQIGDADSAISGRLVNPRGQGQPGYVISLLRANGTALDAKLGTLGTTDSAGAFAAVYDDTQTAVLNKEGELLLRAADAAGREVARSAQALRIAAGAKLQTTLTLPLGSAPPPTAPPAPTPPTPPAPTPPPPAPTPPTQPPSTTPAPPAPVPPAPTPIPPKVRTPLSQLDINADTQKRLIEAGVIDVEGVLEAGVDKIAKIIGDQDFATTLVARARRILAGAAPAPAPKPVLTPTPVKTTPKAPAKRPGGKGGG